MRTSTRCAVRDWVRYTPPWSTPRSTPCAWKDGFPSGCPCPCEPRPAPSTQCRPSPASAVKPPDFAIVLRAKACAFRPTLTIARLYGLRGSVTKLESGWFQSFEHQVDHGYMDPGLAGFGQFLVIFAKPSAAAQPGQRALHHPSAGQHLEVVAVLTASHHLQQPAAGRLSPRDQLAGISGVSPDDLEPREPAQQSGQHQPGSVLVLDTGSMYHHREEQSGGVHYDVALASRHLFARVIAARPPFSVVFTGWLSMMAPLGVASRPSLSRTMGRSASSTRSQVPSLRHFRKYHQTVPQGGRSWGIIRQGMPPRKTYSMALTISRRSEVRGWPLGVSGGNKGSEGPIVPEGPIGHRTNRWDMIFGSYSQTCTQPTHDIKPY